MDKKDKTNDISDDQREQMAMDRLEVFLDNDPDLEPARKTWLCSLFATVMMMGNFSAAIKGLENPEGLRHSDEAAAEPIPGSN